MARAFPIACLVVPLIAAAGDATAAITVNGAAVPHASSRCDVERDISEIHMLGVSGPRVQFVTTRHVGVCIIASGAVPILDTDLAGTGVPSLMTVTVEDGRAFERCLLASLHTDEGGTWSRRRYTYCLTCEHVTAP